MVGTTLGNYKILEKLGAGGQERSIKAVDSKLAARLIKVLPEELVAKKQTGNVSNARRGWRPL